jgi:myo-inositol-1(or 4)-monophosphatase
MAGNGTLRKDGAEMFSTYTYAAIDVAREAGRLLLSLQSQPLKISYKGARDLVTQVDRAAERLIIGALRERFPDHTFLAEEEVQEEGEIRWIIDPIDGTTNYAHGLPLFAVSIALEVRGEVSTGVVFIPALNEMFVAEQGKGAHLDDGRTLVPLKTLSLYSPWRRIRVSSVKDLRESVLSTGLPYDVWETGRNLDHLVRLCRRAQAVRLTGAAAIQLAYVACGRLDGFWEPDLKPWDMAAGSLLVKEAGGTVTLLDGSPFTHHGGEILATNGRIHEQLLAALGEKSS